jgi:NAD(P)-dependent dehydrogenase (short-subunit alcohol dehydrogenase family)
MEKRHEVALVVGVGPGLGFSLARRFARAEMQIALASRHPDRLENIAAECSGIGHGCVALRCDASVEPDVVQLFDCVGRELGDPHLVIYNAGIYGRGSLLNTSAEEFERSWRTGCLGGFLVGREAARRMSARAAAGGPGGTILFTGATASLRGSAQFHCLAVAKAGLRALAQSMARELQASGIHVAHVVIDGRIRTHPGVEHGNTDPGDEMLDADAIAETYYQLHRQPRSAWTLELDLRPWVEKF